MYPDWESTAHFKEWWIDAIKRQGLIPAETVLANKPWFEYLYDEDKPKESRYRCRICNTYFESFGMQQRYKSALVDDSGQLKTSRRIESSQEANTFGI